MKRRRSRRLSDDEATLWRHVTRSILPLPGHELSDEKPDLKSEPPQEKPAPPVSSPIVAAERRPLALPPLAPLERRQMRDLRRGLERIDARIDLHGMRQAQAHGALRAFLLRAHAEGARMVLVVTGKGSTKAVVADPFDERGVLRRVVPQWLGLPDMRPVVLGFSQASREHGGDGAIYVRLRRKGSSHTKER